MVVGLADRPPVGHVATDHGLEDLRPGLVRGLHERLPVAEDGRGHA
jgi:hypothetical protein